MRLAAALFATLCLAPFAARAQDASQFVGRWGFVSYWNEADQRRSFAQARGECGQPYAIARGPNGGVMLHGADAVEASELVLRESGGKRYFVPIAEPSPTNRNAREIVAQEANMFVTRYVDPNAHSRYGYKVYVRCGGTRR